MRWAFLLVLCGPVAVAAERVPAPLPAEQAARSAVLPDGFRMSVFAAEPDVVQPVSFCIDARGRLFVAEALNYGAWQATGKDRIVILEDRDGDGRADSRTLFYEGFNYITGIEVGFGGVWVMSPPTLSFIPDRNGDDRPDGPPEVQFDGFGYKESRHNLANGFTWGPDGWLYGGHGRTSPSDVGRPGTPAEQRIHCDGGVYRIHPTRLVFEVFADGTTNPWGVDFDDYGQCFVSNCVNPHLFHMIPGGHYEPWRNRPSSRYAYERLPTVADHLHYPSGKPQEMRGETPEVLAMGGGHAHCGTLLYLADRFPASFRNTVLMCNVHGRRINNDRLRRQGSGYTASHGKDFFISADPWFMGVTLRTGPDGNVLVSDWSDTGECHTLKPDRGTGRIYKIRYGDERTPQVDLTRSRDAELVEYQLHRNDWFVRHARRLLQERAAQPGWKAEPVHTRLREMLASERLAPPQRLRALWALHVTGGLDRERLVELLGDTSEYLRAWAVQLLCEPGSPGPAALTRFAELARRDPSPFVRLHLAAALQRLPLAERWSIAEGLLSHAADATDANLPLMNWYAVEPLVPADPRKALELARGATIPQVRRYMARRLADGSADLTPLVAVLPQARDDVRVDLLQGAREGLRGRRQLPMPEGWRELYPELGRSPNRALREAAVALALAFGDERAIQDLRRTVEDRTAPAAERVAAIETLVEHRVPDLAPSLQAWLGDPVIRRAALRGLAGLPQAETPSRILALYPRLNADEKAEAIATLASRQEFALPLLDAVERGIVPRGDLTAFTARQLFALGNPRVTERLRQVWGDVRESTADKRGKIARYKAKLTPTALSAADRSRGRVVFARVCQQCHKLFGEGGTIGPDLTGSNRTNLDYLLSNLVDPSAEVGRDYRLSVVKTLDGRVLTGIVVERSPIRLVVQTATEKVLLAAEDVESVKESPVSIMPEGQLDALSADEVRDLIAYLGSPVQVPLPASSAGSK